MVKNKRGRPKNSTRHARIQEIAKLIENVGLWNVHQQPLADKYGISQSQIAVDIRDIKESMNPTDLKDITLNIKLGYKKALNDVFKEMATSTGKGRIEAIQAFNKIGEGFTKFLESYGLKDKVADKLEVSGFIEEQKRVSELIKGMKDEKVVK